MLNVIIFSKDRACQLDLLLTSIKELWVDWKKYKISILWTASTNEYRKGYSKCLSYHPEMNFKKESNFKQDLISLFNLNNPYSIFFVDDQVFKEPFILDCKEFKEFEYDEDIMTLSLRLYPGIKYCYPAKIDSPPPDFIEKFKWYWQGYLGDWGYPYSVDAHIMRTGDLKTSIYKGSYTHPNNFEDWLTRSLSFRPLMSCFEKSKVVNNPINKVGHYHANHCGNISAQTLNEKFLSNSRIDLNSIIGMDPISCHQEFNYEWIKDE